VGVFGDQFLKAEKQFLETKMICVPPHLICSITIMFFLFSRTFCANARYIKRRIFHMRNIMHENPRNHILNI
jgi:hypothetical protein